MNMKDLFALQKISPELKQWVEQFNTPQELLDALPSLVRKYVPEGTKTIKGTVEEGAEIIGDIFIDEGSVIHAGVVIEGPIYIGKNVSVRPHSNLRKGAFLCDDVVIGHGADIKNTFAMPGSKIQDGTFAGDSITGEGARVGSGAIMANRKFNQTSIKVNINGSVEDSNRDFMGAVLGDQARLGANVVTSPGTIIGAYTWVGSGCILSGTIDGDQLVTVKQELDIREKSRVELKSGLGEYEHI